MRNLRPILGSLAVHAAAIGALAWIFHEETPPAVSSQHAPTTIELVDVVELDRLGNAGGGGGATGTPTRGQHDEPVVAPAPKPAARTLVAARSTRSVRASLGRLTIEPGTGNGTGGGNGNGDGPGDGNGSGPGGGVLDLDDTTHGAAVPPPPPAPAENRISKARPARLVYPKREREVEETDLFVARVVVDNDGYVVGARLVRGFGGPRDAEAANLIWRFRYEPALDHDGHPIRSTLDQRFLVNR